MTALARDEITRWPRAMRRLNELRHDLKRLDDIYELSETPPFDKFKFVNKERIEEFNWAPSFQAFVLRLDRVLRDRSKKGPTP